MSKASFAKAVFLCATLIVLQWSAYPVSSQARSSDEEESVVYACRNIPPYQPITGDDLAEAKLERSKIPPGAIKVKSHAIHMNSHGIYLGQFIIIRRLTHGPNGGIIIPVGIQPQKEIIDPKVLKNGSLGVINLNNNWVIEPRYSEIHYAPKAKGFWVTDLKHTKSKAERDKLRSTLGRYIVSDIWTMLDHDGKKIDASLPLCAEGIVRCGTGYLIISSQNKWGLCDEFGNMLVSPRYEVIKEIGDDYIAALKGRKLHWKPPSNGDLVPPLPKERPLHGGWDILDRNCKLICKLPKEVESVEIFADKLLKCGFFTTADYLDPRYQYSLYDYGVINLLGSTVIPPKFIELRTVSEGLAPAKARNPDLGSGFIDKSGRFVIRLTSQYDEYYEGYKSGMAIVSVVTRPSKRDKQGHWEPEKYKVGGIDKSGKVVIPFEYDDLQWLPNNTISASKDKKHFVLDQHLKKIFSTGKALKVKGWSENLYQAWIKDRQNFQYLDVHENPVGPEFYSISDFKNGYAIVSVDHNHFGLIDKKIRWILPPKFHSLERFNDDRFIAQFPDEKHTGVIDKNGHWILPPHFALLKRCGDDRFIARQSN